MIHVYGLFLFVYKFCVEKRARKPWITWITQEMISKMGERRKWKNVNNEEGRRN